MWRGHKYKTNKNVGFIYCCWAISITKCVVAPLRFSGSGEYQKRPLKNMTFGCAWNGYKGQHSFTHTHTHTYTKSCLEKSTAVLLLCQPLTARGRYNESSADHQSSMIFFKYVATKNKICKFNGSNYRKAPFLSGTKLEADWFISWPISVLSKLILPTPPKPVSQNCVHYLYIYESSRNCILPNFGISLKICQALN